MGRSMMVTIDIQFLLRTEKSYCTLKVFGGGGSEHCIVRSSSPRLARFPPPRYLPVARACKCHSQHAGQRELGRLGPAGQER